MNTFTKNNFKNIMKKLFILFAVCCLFAAQSHAQDVQAVSIKKADGTVQSVPLNNLKKITFPGDGNMLFTLADGGENSYIITEINSMVFGLVDGVANKNISPKQFVSYSAGKDEIKMNIAEGAAVQVYGANGQLVKSAAKLENGILNIAGLAKGVYIIKSGNQTAKIVKL